MQTHLRHHLLDDSPRPARQPKLQPHVREENEGCAIYTKALLELAVPERGQERLDCRLCLFHFLDKTKLKIVRGAETDGEAYPHGDHLVQWITDM